MITRRAVVVAVLLSVFGASASAATISWNNPAGGNWGTAANWTPAQVPTSGDDAVIALAGTYTVNLNVSANLASLTLGGATGIQTLANAGSTLTLANASSIAASGVLTQSAGTLTGGGALSVDGLVNWNGGTFGGSGVLTVNATGTLVIGGAADKFLNPRNIDNFGTVRWDQGRILFQNLAVLNNYNLFDIRSDDVITSTAAGGTINNSGTLRKKVATGTTTIVQHIHLANSGTLDILSGVVTPLAATLNTGTNITGTGFLVDGGTVSVAGASTVTGTMEVTSGTLAGASTLTVNGTLNWTGGTLGGNGAVDVSSVGTLHISGAPDKFLSVRTINNSGTIEWLAGRILFQNFGVLNNLAGGTFDIQADLTMTSTSAGGTINNSGLIVKSAGAGTAVAVTHVRLENNGGTLHVPSGTLLFENAGLNHGTQITGTGYRIGGGTNTVTGTATVAGTATLASGTLNGAGTFQVNGLLHWTGGSMAQAGTTLIAAGGTMQLSGASDKFLDVRTVDNHGTTTWTGTGRLLFQNSPLFINHADGVFEAQSDSSFTSTSVGGSFRNYGTFRKTAGAGTTTVVVHVSILNDGGTFDVTSGTITIDSTMTLAGTSSFTGTGDTRVTGAITGTASIAGTRLVLLGTLNGTGILTVTGTMGWNAGSMSTNGGTTNIAAGATLNIAGAADKFLDTRVLNNYGTVNWMEGRILFQNNGTFNNEPGALFDITTDSTFTSSSVGGTFNNEGTFRKSGGSGVTTIVVHVKFNNTDGLIDVLNGSIVADSPMIMSGTTMFSGAGAFKITGPLSGTATLAGNVELAGGSFTGSGIITITGTLTWTTGTMNGSGSTVIAPGGVLKITGAVDRFLDVRTLDNSGTTIWDGGRLFFQNNAQFKNNTGALFETRHDDVFTSTSVGGRFTNEGTFRKTTATGTTTIVVHIAVTSNGGTFDIQTGTLTIDSPLTLSGTSSFTGAGTTKITGVLNGTGTVAGRLQLAAGGNLSGAGTITIAGTLDWVAGSMSTGTGTTVIAPGGVLNLSGGDRFLDARTLSNAGTVNWTAGRLFFQNSADFVNQAGGVFAVQIDSQFTSTSVGGAFANAGTFTKNTPGTVTMTHVGFTNSGLLDVQSGTLRFEKSFTQTAGTTMVHGRIESTTNVTIQGGILGGTGTFAANVTSSGDVRPGASPGTLTIQGNYTQTAGGTLTIEIASASSYDQLAITGTFNVDGTLHVVSPYSPADGETFTVATFAARNGDFANVTGVNIGAGKSYAPAFSPTALILTAEDTAANLYVDFVDTPDPVNQGEELTYTVTVTNGAATGATGVMMTDTLPFTVTFESATPSQGSCSGTEIVECNLGSLAAGASATVAIVVTPTQYGTIANQVEVTQNEPDPNLDNNTFASVTEVNGTPVPVDDSATTDEETPVTVDVLANDFEPEEDLLVVATFTQGAHGAVSCDATDCTYVPETDFAGTDTFTYTVSDPGNATATATVTITVNDVVDENEPPVAVDDAAATTDAVTVNVLANDSDPDGDALTIVAHSDPATGQARCSETRCTYWARHGFRGTDSFTYTISDGSDTAKATVRITVAREGCPETVSLTEPPAGGTAPAGGTLRWTATGADYYDVYLGPAGEGCAKRLARVTEPFADYANLAQNGAYEWRVEAVATGCGVVASPCSGFTVRPACATPEAPAASVVAQATSGQPYAVSWASLGAGVHYEVEEADNASFIGATVTRVDGTSVSFTHTAEPSALPFFYRVRAVSACLGTAGPYSTTIRIVITPLPRTIERHPTFHVPAGSTQTVVQSLFLPGDGTSSQQFSIETDEPWLTVAPSHGVLPPSGILVQLLANPANLPNGTVTGTVIVTITPRTALGGPQAQGTTTTSIPISLNLVTPVFPLPAPEGTPAHALIIPTVGHLGGAGSQWQSDVRVTNTSSAAMKYQLTFMPSDAAAKIQQTTIDVQPGVTTALDDIVRNWFGQGALGEASIGFLKIVALTNPSARTVASSRTFNLTANGTLGQFIPAIPFSSFVGKAVSSLAAPILSLQQVAESAAYRTNVGLLEASGKPVSLLMTVFDVAGNTLKELPISLGAGELRQMNGVLAQHGIMLDDGRIEVRVVGGEGKVTAYASTIDNQTNDPLLVSAATLGGAPFTRYVLPGAADIDTGSAHWRTDLRIFNDGTEPQLASVVLYADEGEAVERSIVVAPREVKVLDSVVRELFGKTQSGGAIHVSTATPSRLVVTGRTYNQTDHGTFGLFAPAVTLEEATGARERTLHIPQVEDSSRYRTNVGVAEVSGKETTIEIGVSLPNAKATPNVRVTLAPNEFRQFVGLLRSMGLQNVYNARVTVRVVEGEGRVTAYGAIVDAETNDPTYVPAQ